MTISPGTRLGPYEIVAPLGAGGMGEVYRARDPRLGREVAIKVLPQHLSANPEVRARFEREAKAVAALSHPHICALYDVGTHDGTDYLVMELLEGETLAARLARGPLPLAELLRVGAQIADALDKAHRKGLVHRDLKPANVMLTKSGAKLLDFGLARATGLAPAGADAVSSPTLTRALTTEGSIVGTFLYMSPEQLEGKESDGRSDLWALGCLLYEMATGTRAFAGSTQASLISAIMRDHPRPIAELSPLSPAALDRLVQQCLAKDPDDRWQSAGDVKRELQWVAASSTGAGVPAPLLPAPRGRKRAWLPWAACGVLLAALAVEIIAGGGDRHGAPERLMRFVVPQPADATLSVPCEPSLGPDGSTLAFALLDSTFTRRLAVRPLRTTEIRLLPGTEGASLPFWSPDGRWIGFFANGKLMKVALDGSAPVALCDAPDGRGGAWAPGGTIYFAPNNSGPVFRVAEAGGDPVPVTRIDAAHREFGQRYPHLLPDGRHFLYVSIRPGDRPTVCVGSVDGKDTRELFVSHSAARYARGFLLTNERGRVMARRFDPGSLTVHGDPQLVAEGAEQDNIGYDNLALDARGTLVFQRRTPQPARLVWQGPGGAPEPSPWGVLPEFMFTLLAPDGQRLVYLTRDPIDVWVQDHDDAAPTRLTFEDRNVNGIAISPDSRRVAFGRQLGSGAYELRVKLLDGSGPETGLFRGPALFAVPAAWSPDGQWIVTAVSDSIGSFDFWLVPADGGGQPRVFERTPSDEYAASISPDGRWMVYGTIERDRTAVYVVSFPSPDAKYQISLPEPVYPAVTWSPNGRELIVGDRRNHLLAVEVQTTPAFRQGATRILLTLPPNSSPVGMTPDGSRLLLALLDPTASRAALEVVLGWPGLIEVKQ